MKPLQVADKTYGCLHWREFPPPFAVGMDATAEELRAAKRITDAAYGKIKVWQRVCGLTAMDEGKCLTCPLVRTVEWKDHLPVLVDGASGHAVPAVDATSLSTVAYRGRRL